MDEQAVNVLEELLGLKNALCDLRIAVRRGLGGALRIQMETDAKTPMGVSPNAVVELAKQIREFASEVGEIQDQVQTVQEVLDGLGWREKPEVAITPVDPHPVARVVSPDGHQYWLDDKGCTVPIPTA